MLVRALDLSELLSPGSTFGWSMFSWHQPGSPYTLTVQKAEITVLYLHLRVSAILEVYRKVERRTLVPGPADCWADGAG